MVCRELVLRQSACPVVDLQTLQSAAWPLIAKPCNPCLTQSLHMLCIPQSVPITKLRVPLCL